MSRRIIQPFLGPVSIIDYRLSANKTWKIGQDRTANRLPPALFLVTVEICHAEAQEILHIIRAHYWSAPSGFINRRRAVFAEIALKLSAREHAVHPDESLTACPAVFVGVDTQKSILLLRICQRNRQLSAVPEDCLAFQFDAAVRLALECTLPVGKDSLLIDIGCINPKDARQISGSLQLLSCEPDAGQVARRKVHQMATVLQA